MTSANDNLYQYDANGNQTVILGYDARDDILPSHRHDVQSVDTLILEALDGARQSVECCITLLLGSHARPKLLKRISMNLNVMTGKPVICGMRLTVEYILNLLAHDKIPKRSSRNTTA